MTEQHPKQLLIRPSRPKFRSLGYQGPTNRICNVWLHCRDNCWLSGISLLRELATDCPEYRWLLDGHPLGRCCRRAHHLPQGALECIQFRCLGEPQSSAVWVGRHRSVRFWLPWSRYGHERVMVPCPNRTIDWKEGCEYRARAHICVFGPHIPSVSVAGEAIHGEMSS